MKKNNKSYLWAGLLLFFSLLNISAVLAEEPIEYRFERMWPKLAQPWYFNKPIDIAVTANGNVYVLDQGFSTSTVTVFTPNGEFIRSWIALDSIGIDPNKIAISPDGNNVYILFDIDGLHYFVRKYKNDGTFLQVNWMVGESFTNYPTDLAIGSDDNVYLNITSNSESVNNKIMQFSANGVLMQTLAAQVKSFSFAISFKNTVYFLDSSNHQIHQLNGQGELIRSWGSKGSANGQFNTPSNLAIGPKGNVYVTDAGNYRIQKFSAGGDFIKAWGNAGSGNGQFNRLDDIAIAPNGNVYVTDRGNQLVQQFNTTGGFIQTWRSNGSDEGKFNNPHGIAFSDQGVYVTDRENHRIQQFDSNGKFIRAWGSQGSGDGQFLSPHGIAIGSNNSIYVADTGNHRIQKFDSNGIFIKAWGTEGSGDEQFKFPQGIAIGLDNSIYVVDDDVFSGNGNNRIVQFDSDGKFIKAFASFTSDFRQVSHIATGPEGSVYIVDNDRVGIPRDPIIRKFNINGEFMWEKPIETSVNFDELYLITGIVIGSDGSIFMTNIFDQIERYNAEGVFIKTMSFAGSSAGNVFSPRGLTVDPDGNLYVADSGNNRIQKFTQRINSSTAHDFKAIILAGGGPSKGNYINNIWDGTEVLGGKAYRALRLRGFAKDEVKYLTAGNIISDLDNNGKTDDLEAASLNSLKQAITVWAKDTRDVVIYLIDHGGPGEFEVNDREILTAEQLGAWVNQLDDMIPGQVTVIIESCKSASFFGSLAKQKRNLIASADVNQSAKISNGGLTSFSYYFWTEILDGANLQDAFQKGKQAMSAEDIPGQGRQKALLDSNGDQKSTQNDFTELAGFCIGKCTTKDSTVPKIIDHTANKMLTGETSMQLTMQIQSVENILQAWVIVIPPDFKHPDTNDPISELDKIPLQCDALKHCTINYAGLDLIGDYQFTFYAQDEKFQMALPFSATIKQTQGKVSEPTATYNEQTLSVFINDVQYGNDHYQAELIHPAGDYTFSVKSAAKLLVPALENPNRLDSTSFDLILNKVSAFGNFYKVMLKHLGELVFRVESVEEVPE